MATIKCYIGMNGKPMSTEEKLELDRKSEAYDEAVRIAQTEPPKRARKGGMHGKWMGSIYGK